MFGEISRSFCPSQCPFQVDQDEDDRHISQASQNLKFSLERGLPKRQKDYLDSEQPSEDGAGSFNLAVNYGYNIHPHDAQHYSASDERTFLKRHQTLTYFTKKDGRTKKMKRSDDPSSNNSNDFRNKQLGSRPPL